MITRIHVSWTVLLVSLLAYPLFASNFFVLQIGAYSMILGVIGLSLMVLAGYGGMVSLSQLTVAGVAGYSVAILGENSSGVMGLGWSPWVVVFCVVILASISAALIGVISVRTKGIYTIMITLAITVAFFYFVRQNYDVFNGFTGFSGIKAPIIFGFNLNQPTPFYYATLVVTFLCLWAVIFASRSVFGLTLQALRDNPRRMQALGYNVKGHKIFAHFLSGVMAAIAGVLLVWFNSRISPGSVGINVALDILVIAVIGGLRHPIGPFLGALLFVLLENFAIDFFVEDRFNTVIGAVFLTIVLFSPDGLLGLWEKASSFLGLAPLTKFDKSQLAIKNGVNLNKQSEKL